MSRRSTTVPAPTPSEIIHACVRMGLVPLALGAALGLWLGCSEEPGPRGSPGAQPGAGGSGGAPAAPGGQGGTSGDPTPPAGGAGPGGSAGSGPAPRSKVSVTLDGLDRFLTAPGPVAIKGQVTADRGVGDVMVAGSPAMLDAGGRFEATAQAPAGVSLVEIAAHDRGAPAAERKAHRSVIVARYLPEDQPNADAAAVGLSSGFLRALIAPYTMQIANLDLAAQIRMAGLSISQQGCDITLENVTAGRPSLSLDVTAAAEGTPGGDLQIAFGAPMIDVAFRGSCTLPLAGNVRFRGNLTTDVAVKSLVSAPLGEACVTTFTNTFPTVELPNLDLQVRNDGTGGLIGLVIPLVGGIMRGQVAMTMSEQIAMTADGLIKQQLAMLSVFSGTQPVMFGASTIQVGFCLTGLAPVDTPAGRTLTAKVGLRARGPGGLDAPGAPQVDGALGAPATDTLLVDANLIGQLLFSIWRAGGISGSDSSTLQFGLLALLAPDLAGRYPDETPVEIKISAELPPLVRAADPAAGDLVVEIGDLMVDLSVQGQQLFRIGLFLMATVDLTPMGAMLKPEVKAVQARVHVLDEPVADIDDMALEGAVQSQLDAAARRLFGDTAFALPNLGVTLRPRDVTADPGGRYLRIPLDPVMP